MPFELLAIFLLVHELLGLLAPLNPFFLARYLGLELGPLLNRALTSALLGFVASHQELLMRESLLNRAGTRIRLASYSPVPSPSAVLGLAPCAGPFFCACERKVRAHRDEVTMGTRQIVRLPPFGRPARVTRYPEARRGVTFGVEGRRAARKTSSICRHTTCRPLTMRVRERSGPLSAPS